ncbi:MAG: hypothetical protein C0594_00845 [Marinilabiliales bacterium]|nr:MAG: hypothetical protein C0594_00845 [Marinilabiliales bacterium]
MRFVLVGIIFGALIVSCNKPNITLHSKEYLLTRTFWEMESFVDHNSNTSLETSDAIVKFKDDGTLILFPGDTLLPQNSTWELMEKNKYLRMGNNTFKVKIISKSLLGLQYGKVDIFYIPMVD